ncbi:MAG: outer membrane protein transport protein [Acidobacteriota bacterium]|jgi:long-chain fatty acid transport protein|nr:outer membrane protein transport protein [Acidobacteriota bacterium]
MKQMEKTARLIVTVALIVLASTSLSANGLNLNGLGSKAIAMGGAFIGQADDYSAIFWNPAGLTQMKNAGFSLFITDLIPSGTYTFPIYGIDAKTKSAMYPSGALGYFKPINDKLVIGISAYVPSGTGAKWDGEELKLLSKGAVYKWESFMAVISVSPVIAYKVSDTFSLGATLNLDYGMMKIKRPGVGQYTEDLSGFAFGATIGALFMPIDRLGVGLTLRTPTKVKFSGDAEMASASAYGLATTSDAEREATWPLWLGLGISFKATDKLTLNADAQYTNWKKIDTIGITYDDAVWQSMKSHPLLGAAFNNDFVLNWKNATQLRFGAEYAVSEKLALRAGYYYDPSPSPAETLNILLPEVTYNVITAGLGYKAEKLAIDFCLEYLMGKDQESPLSGKMPGTHGMSILVPNIAFSYRF